MTLPEKLYAWNYCGATHCAEELPCEDVGNLECAEYERTDHIANAGKMVDDRFAGAVNLIETLVRALSDVQCRDDFDKFEVDSALDEYKKWKAENENS